MTKNAVQTLADDFVADLRVASRASPVPRRGRATPSPVSQFWARIRFGRPSHVA